MPLTVTTSRPVLAKINENGRIVIPAGLREQMGLKAGESVVMEVEDGVLHIESHRARIRRIQEEFKQFAPKDGTLASDQLIVDRREEARREMEQGLA